jgi:cyclopropane fatty-acyl-phospholipid synthase-like methyltransferase
MDSNTPNAPYDLLDRWINHVEIGRTLDLGAGEGVVSIWLAKNDFAVDAVERDSASFKQLQEAAEGMNVRCIQADITEMQLEPQVYSLITSFGVLHFLRPTDLWTIADHLVESLSPGGMFMSEVFTIDDPGFNALRSGGVEMIEPNTFRLPSPQKLIHYFEPGEMERVFSDLEVLESEEYRRIDSESEEGFRAGAAFVGRKRKG